MKARQTGISYKLLPNGNIRAHTNDARMGGVSERQYTHPNNIAPTVTAAGHGKVQITKDMAKRYRIRKLTPTECFRLMDVPEADIEKMKNAGISNAQLYKLAGNSIVVAVLKAIFTKMFEDEQVQIQETLFG